MNRELLLSMVFKMKGLSSQRVMRGIESTLKENHVDLKSYTMSGDRETSLAALQARLIRSGENTFHIDGRGFHFDFSSIYNHSLDFFEIRFSSSCGVFYEQWVKRFSIDPDFVLGWLADAEYEYWQNAFDPLQFTCVNKPFEHLPMKTNGLPYPLEQMIVDTSANPGRRILRVGYIEAVGSIMWLGEPFWSVTRATTTLLERLDWAKITSLGDGITKIQSAEKPFSTTEGRIGEIQRILRSTLFPDVAG